jgi:hypothetical protein
MPSAISFLSSYTQLLNKLNITYTKAKRQNPGKVLSHQLRQHIEKRMSFFLSISFCQ